MHEEYYWVAFSCCPGIGPIKFYKLLHAFGTAENAWQASEEALVSSSIGNAAIASFVSFRKQFSPESYYESLQKKQVTVMYQGGEYPLLLRQIDRPPIVLYILGNKDLLKDEKVFAVVGTRKVTAYGRQVTQTLTRELVRAGFVVVSGLAMGVDAVAHHTTLEEGGKTIAVLGSGVDICTPLENYALYAKIIASGGAIVSEVPMGVMPNKGSFPSRNRIIAGLAEGVLITEGAEDSGSLITARDASKNQRKVFAVPGPITSFVSQGPNQLIRNGAKMVISGRDLMDELGVSSQQRQTQSAQGDSPEEKKVLNLLGSQSLYFDDIVRASHLDPSALGIMLSLMEMKGYIKRLETGQFSLP